MPLFNKTFSITYVLLLLITTSGYSQFYNTEVEAKIYLEKNNEFIEIKGASFNKTNLSQSLRYVLSVIRTDPETGDKTKNDQSGRFVLGPRLKANLSNTTINANDPARTIVLLLVYNEEEKIVGKDRVVLNDDPANNDKDAVTIESPIDETARASVDDTSADVNTGAEDGIVLRGIVVEESKTKPGRDFYKLFYSAYVQYNLNSKEIVTVKEVFALGRNTKAEVFVGETLVFTFFLKPQQDFLKEMTNAAIYYVNSHMQRQTRDSKIVKRY